MANINVRIDDRTETALKKEAVAFGISLSDLVRERLTGEKTSKSTTEVTLENKIEQLEKQQKRLASHLYFQSRFLYQFAILAADAEKAAGAWETAKKELNKGE